MTIYVKGMPIPEKITRDPSDMARDFSEMDQFEQAAFFKALQEIGDEWANKGAGSIPIQFDKILQAMGANRGGLRVIRQLVSSMVRFENKVLDDE